jgi:hypothetical protein
MSTRAGKSTPGVISALLSSTKGTRANLKDAGGTCCHHHIFYNSLNKTKMTIGLIGVVDVQPT